MHTLRCEGPFAPQYAHLQSETVGDTQFAATAWYLMSVYAGPIYSINWFYRIEINKLI